MFLMCSVDLREAGIHTRSNVGGDLSSGRDVILRTIKGNNGTSETKIREIQLSGQQLDRGLAALGVAG